MSAADRNVAITLALCTHNHADRLGRTLDDLASLQHPECAWELLVIDNGSTDATSSLLAETGWRPPGVPVRVVGEDRLGLSNARNRALQEMAGEYIVFMDDDETPGPGWLRAYHEAIAAYRPDAIGGRIEVLFEGERPSWLGDELLGFLGQLDHGEARWLADRSTTIFGGNFGVQARRVRADRELRPGARAHGRPQQRRRGHGPLPASPRRRVLRPVGAGRRDPPSYRGEQAQAQLLPRSAFPSGADGGAAETRW